MNIPLRRLALSASFLFASVFGTTALAEKPTWTPVAELLVGSIGYSDPMRMSSAMHRCTALNMVLSGMVSEYSPTMSQSYQDEAMRLIQNGILIETRLAEELTGAEADLDALSDASISQVKGLVAGYNDWMDDNFANEGLYFNKDIELEMDACQLASRLANEML